MYISDTLYQSVLLLPGLPAEAPMRHPLNGRELSRIP